MGEKGGKAPPAPDPTQVGGAQTTSNLNTAIANSFLNNTNQIGPNGSLTYQQTGTQHIQVPTGTDRFGNPTYSNVDLPTWTQTETLSPEQQRLQDQQNSLRSSSNSLAQDQISRLSGILGRPVDASGLPQIQSTINGGGPIQRSIGPTAGNIQYDVRGSQDFDAAGREAQDAIMQRLQPQMDRARAARETGLANQGIELGSEAHRTAENLLGQNENDARTQAVLAGYQRQNDLFGQNLQSGQFHNAAQGQDYSQLSNNAQFANAAQNQDFNQAASRATFNNQAAGQSLQQTLALRNQPINEITALMNGGQVSMPQFQGYNAAQVQGTPIGQYMYNSAAIDQSNYQAQANRDLQSQQGMTGGLFGLGSAGLFGLAKSGAMASMFASDRRLKRDIERIGTHPNGFGVYSFRYIPEAKLGDDLTIGFMADEVEKVKPEAVHTGADGFKSVDYALAAA